MKRFIALACCLQLCIAGCAMRSGGAAAAANRKAERLALEKGRLVEATDATTRTKSCIVISDILLDFAVDAMAEQDHEGVRRLLMEYGRTLGIARDDLRKATRQSRKPPQIYFEFEKKLGLQLQTLERVRAGATGEDRELVDQAAQTTAALRQELLNALS